MNKQKFGNAVKTNFMVMWRSVRCQLSTPVFASTDGYIWEQLLSQVGNTVREAVNESLR